MYTDSSLEFKARSFIIFIIAPIICIGNPPITPSESSSFCSFLLSDDLLKMNRMHLQDFSKD